MLRRPSSVESLERRERRAGATRGAADRACLCGAWGIVGNELRVTDRRLVVTENGRVRFPVAHDELRRIQFLEAVEAGCQGHGPAERDARRRSWQFPARASTPRPVLAFAGKRLPWVSSGTSDERTASGPYESARGSR